MKAWPQASEMSSRSDSIYWSLLQTLGWIFIRDQQLVEELGETRLQQNKQNQITLLLAADEMPPRYRSLEEAKEDLYEALRTGAVTAIGLLDNRGEATLIPAVFWAHGKFYEDPEVAGPTTLFPTASLWHGLRFPRREILQLWPAPQAQSAPSDLSSVVRLSFEQLAGRWLSETPAAGITQESLAVDLIQQAEAGAFLTTLGEDEPHGPNFDPRLGKHVNTYDRDGEPTAPHWISNYVRAGRAGSGWDLRLKAARDIAVSLSAVGEWLQTNPGSAWMATRGLVRPRFIRAPFQPKITSTVGAEGRCTKWLTDLMRAGDPTVSKDDLKVAAMTQFAISGAGFQRCWTTAVHASGNFNWSKSGPRKRRKEQDF